MVSQAEAERLARGNRVPLKSYAPLKCLEA